MIIPTLALSLALGQHIGWNVGLRAEVRARTPVGGNDRGTEAAGDAEIDPNLGLTISGSGWLFNTNYSAFLRTREPYLDPRFEQSHRGNISLEYNQPNNFRLYARYFFGYGLLDLSTLYYPGSANGTTPANPNMPTQPNMPTGGMNMQNSTIDALRSIGLTTEIDSDFGAGFDLTLSRTLNFNVDVGYYWGGGADYASSLILPLQSNPRAAAKLTWLLTPTDSVAVSLGVLYSLFGLSTGDSMILTTNLLGVWNHQLGPLTSFDVSVGATYAWEKTENRLLGPQTGTGYDPAVGAGISHRLMDRKYQVDFRVQAAVGPFVDRFSGSVYERAEGSLALGWSGFQSFSAYIRGGAAQALTTGVNEFASVFGEAGVGYQGATWWRLDLRGSESLFKVGSLFEGLKGWQNTWLVSLSWSLTFVSL